MWRGCCGILVAVEEVRGVLQGCGSCFRHVGGAVECGSCQDDVGAAVDL